MGLSPRTPPKTLRVTWQANMDLEDECQVIHEFSFVKCCLSYLNIFSFKRDSYLFGDTVFIRISAQPRISAYLE